MRRKDGDRGINEKRGLGGREQKEGTERREEGRRGDGGMHCIVEM